MSYGRNFGMRSFENVVRDGRFRVPSTGTPFKIGAPVMLDPDNPGRLKAATEAVAPSQACGLVVFEHIQNKSDALVTNHDAPYNQVPLGQYAQMMHGAGAKVWFMNTEDKALYDGRVQEGGGLLDDSVDVADLSPGDGLVPAGNGKFRTTDGSDTADIGGAAWLVVEQANPSTGRVEARLTF
jgi:hypothetical protein